MSARPASRLDLHALTICDREAKRWTPAASAWIPIVNFADRSWNKDDGRGKRFIKVTDENQLHVSHFRLCISTRRLIYHLKVTVCTLFPLSKVIAPCACLMDEMMRDSDTSRPALLSFLLLLYIPLLLRSTIRLLHLVAQPIVSHAAVG